MTRPDWPSRRLPPMFCFMSRASWPKTRVLSAARMPNQVGLRFMFRATDSSQSALKASTAPAHSARGSQPAPECCGRAIRSRRHIERPATASERLRHGWAPARRRGRRRASVALASAVERPGGLACGRAALPRNRNGPAVRRATPALPHGLGRGISLHEAPRSWHRCMSMPSTLKA